VFENSPIEAISFEGKPFFIKRDDLLDSDFSGNKARKLHYYIQEPFPSIKKIISYGSIQSNMMYSLSVLAKRRGWRFDYYISHLPRYLAQHPQGNYKGALNNGMYLFVGEALPPKSQSDHSTLWIEEGGHQAESSFGVTQLAKEIMQWQAKEHGDSLDIFLPSGTGTTALFLSKALKKGGSLNSVYTTACVADDLYLKRQFIALERDEIYHPTILSLDKKHHFGKLYEENYSIWKKLKEQTGIEFDLLYDPLGWRVLLDHYHTFKRPILYIQQGGVLGNESMLPRFERKYAK
jgi:1-aminocyclopropane-1-carboxylate deaminase